MNSDSLPPVLLSANKRYSISIPQGKLTPSIGSQIPVITRRGSGKGNPLSMREVMTDSAIIDMKLKSLSNVKQGEHRVSIQSERKQKANLKFLQYKFNPGAEDKSDNIEKGIGQQRYGQLGSKQKISINTFYESKNVIFQDERAPLIYKKLFLEKESHA